MARRPVPLTNPRQTIAAQRQALKRHQAAAHKADLVRRGLCRQCGKRRGRSPSAGRCLRCLKLERERLRRQRKGQPYAPGKPGRPPLQAKAKP